MKKASRPHNQIMMKIMI